MYLRSVMLLTVLAAAGCARHRVVASAALVHPAATKGWVDTRLYFGLGLADRPESGISEADWRGFLDAEVTPRFPDGLSVLDVYGQWRGRADGAVARLRSKLLVIDYDPTPENEAKVEAIRAAWKSRFHAQSVLRVTEPAAVSF